MVFLGYRLSVIVYTMNTKNIQASTVCIKIRLFVKLICFERPFIDQLSLGSPDVIFSVKIFPMNILLEIDILMVYFWKRKYMDVSLTVSKSDDYRSALVLLLCSLG